MSFAADAGMAQTDIMERTISAATPNTDTRMFDGDARDFQRKDLIYGLAAPREEFVSWLEHNKRIDSGEPIFIDQYDIASADRQTANALRHDHRFVEALRARYPDVVRAADDGLDLTDERVWDGPARAETYRIAKRKCKGGLEWLMFGPHGNDDKRCVHFVVDGLDEHVPAKDYSGHGEAEFKNGSTKHRTVTGAELRWVYRNRESAQVADNILFWRSSRAGWEQCEAPWSDSRSSRLVRDAWSAYGGQSMNDLQRRFEQLRASPKTSSAPARPTLVRRYQADDRMDID